MKPNSRAMLSVEIGYVALFVAAVVAKAVSGFDPLGLPRAARAQLVIGIGWYLGSGVLFLLLAPGAAAGRRRIDLTVACGAFVGGLFGVTRLLF